MMIRITELKELNNSILNMKCRKCEQQVQKEERETEIIVSIFSGAYLLLIVVLLVGNYIGI